MRDLIDLRRAGEGAVRLAHEHARRLSADGALRRIAELLGEEALPPRADDEAVDATIVFADIESFSDLVAREGDEAATRVLDALDAAVEAAVAGTTVRVVKRLGDGVMLASEDPGDAVSAAAALPARFAAAIAAEPFELRLRAGAHRGVVRRRGEDLIGYHVNVAARVAERAPGGTTLVTGALRDSVLLSQRLTATPCGVLVAKGVPERPPLYALVGVPEDPGGAALAG